MTHKLKPAFNTIKKNGVFCRTNRIVCCQSCTHDALKQISNEYIGFHLQNLPIGQLFQPQSMDVPFEGITLLHRLESDESRQMVRDTFVSHGLAVRWNGERNKTIHITVPLSPKYLWSKLRAHVKMRNVFWFWHSLTSHLHADAVESDKRMRSNIKWHPLAPDAAPIGVTKAFNDVYMRICLAFERPSERWIHRLEREGTYRPVAPAIRGAKQSHDEQQLEWQMNGGDVASAEFTAPTRYEPCFPEAPKFVELKGSELDQIAFNGPVFKMRSYKSFSDTYDYVREFPAPAGDCFTISELKAVMEPELRWIARAQQYQGILGFGVARDHFASLDEWKSGVYETKWTYG